SRMARQWRNCHLGPLTIARHQPPSRSFTRALPISWLMPRTAPSSVLPPNRSQWSTAPLSPIAAKPVTKIASLRTLMRMSGKPTETVGPAVDVLKHCVVDRQWSLDRAPPYHSRITYSRHRSALGGHTRTVRRRYLRSEGRSRSRPDTPGHATKTVRDRDVVGSNPGLRPVMNTIPRPHRLAEVWHLITRLLIDR